MSTKREGGFVMRIKSLGILVCCAVLLSCGIADAGVEYLTRIYPGDYEESYNPVSTTGLGAGAAGNIMTTKGGTTRKVYVGDFDNDGYDEMYQISDASEYYVKPEVVGTALTGTQYTWSGASPNNHYSVGKYFSGDSREYLITHVPGTAADYMGQVNADGSMTNIGTGNIDGFSVMTNPGYFAGDYDGDGLTEVFAIHNNNQGVYDAITVTAGVMSATTNVVTPYFAIDKVNMDHVVGYFVANGGRDQLLRLVNDAQWSGVDKLFTFHNGSNWVAAEADVVLGAANLFGDFSYADEDLVTGDFDNDGLDELLIIGNSANDKYYDAFSVAGGVLSATVYTVDLGSPGSWNFAVNFIPEPVTLTMLAFGGVLVLVRRKR